MLRSLPLWRTDSWYQKPREGFHISMSPFGRPRAKRRVEGVEAEFLGILAREACEKARALIAEGG